MKLFTLGPVEKFQEVKNASLKDMVYFRTEIFGKLVNECLNKTANLLETKNNSSLIYLSSSGTGAMEAVVDNCISKDEKVLIINGGSFGERFCQICKWHNIKYSSINLKWNETLNEIHLEPFKNKGFTTLLVNLHETSTGQLYCIKLLSTFCKENNIFFVVDAIGTFLADEYKIDKWGIDVTIISSQKGFCLSSGMSIVAFSGKMLEKLKNLPNSTSLYFNFKDYLKNIQRGQTPFTPTVSIIYELKAMLDFIEISGGKKEWLKVIEKKATYFRKKANKANLEMIKYPQSNMLTSLYFEDKIAKYITENLIEKYEIYVNPCGGELANKLLRVSHIGNTTIEDIDYLIEKIVEVKERLK